MDKVRYKAVGRIIQYTLSMIETSVVFMLSGSKRRTIFSSAPQARISATNFPLRSNNIHLHIHGTLHYLCSGVAVRVYISA